MNNSLRFERGRISVSERDSVTGKRKTVDWLGQVATANVALTTEKLEHYERYTGQNLKDVEIDISKNATFTATVENFDLDALALALYGQKVSVTGASITDEAAPSGLVVGSVWMTAHPDISAVTVETAAGSALTAGTDYEIQDAKTGRIKLLTAQTSQPLTVSYTYASRKDLSIFTTTAPERWVTFEGYNLVTQKKQIVNLFKVRFMPASQIPLIADNQIQSYELQGGVLYDELAPQGGTLGGFGSIQDLS